ncbi:MAG: hypothetical protein KY455_07450 [Euryarchaeota archaeon]|nr:hypothetical protein [Euryarchaeota archaeon]
MKELQRHAVYAIVGLIAFFPIFNQVAITAQDALRDADHKSKFKDFIKDWDDIPEDEKLSYWDGKSRPPGQQGDIDEDKVDDDGRFHEPDEPPPQDTDGDGVPDEDDADPEDPKVQTDEEKARVRDVQVEMFRFTGEDTPVNEQSRRISVADNAPEGGEWEFVHTWVTWDVETFSGSYDFALSDDRGVLWEISEGNPVPRTTHDDDGTSETKSVQGDMSMRSQYTPLANSAPQRFDIVVYGQYRVYEDAPQ